MSPVPSEGCSSKSSSASVWLSLTSPLGAPLLLAAWYSLPSPSFSRLLRTMMDSRMTSTVLSRTCVQCLYRSQADGVMCKQPFFMVLRTMMDSLHHIHCGVMYLRLTLMLSHADSLVCRTFFFRLLGSMMDSCITSTVLSRGCVQCLYW